MAPRNSLVRSNRVDSCVGDWLPRSFPFPTPCLNRSYTGLGTPVGASSGVQDAGDRYSDQEEVKESDQMSS
jgi:hypothetical protein